MFYSIPVMPHDEQRLHALVNKSQAIPKIMPRRANPHSGLGLMLLHGAVRVASAPALGACS